MDSEDSSKERPLQRDRFDLREPVEERPLNRQARQLSDHLKPRDSYRAWEGLRCCWSQARRGQRTASERARGSLSDLITTG